MDDSERIALLERRLEHYDVLVQRLIAYARLTPAGRLALKALGLA